LYDAAVQPNAKSSLPLRVGEVARRSGLTVRTLHHYHRIGLLRPSGRTASSHRLYIAADLARLQQIVSLRHLGLPLLEIKECLRPGGFSPLQTIRLHNRALREKIRGLQNICRRLDSLQEMLESSKQISTEEFFQTMEAIVMFEKYYTPEQLETLKKRTRSLGPQGMEAAHQEWRDLMSAIKAEMKAGTDPADPTVQTLARRWGELIGSFTGGDPQIAQSLRKMWTEQGSQMATKMNMDFDPELFKYVQKARTVAE
jgi:DNA-binding transcriptional MerR regulator